MADVRPALPFARSGRLAAAALCWSLFAVLAAAVQSHAIDGLDRTGLTIWRRTGDLALARGPAGLLEAMRDFTALGGPLLRNLFAFAALIALMLMRDRLAALRYALVVSGGWLVDVAMKVAVGRARPMVVPHLIDVTGNSFPSGHSFNAAVVYVAMGLTFAAQAPGRNLQRLLMGSALVLSLLVSATRVWLGVHFPSDVVAGWLGGTGWALLATGVVEQRGAQPCPVESGSDAANRWPDRV